MKYSFILFTFVSDASSLQLTQTSLFTHSESVGTALALRSTQETNIIVNRGSRKTPVRPGVSGASGDQSQPGTRHLFSSVGHFVLTFITKYVKSLQFEHEVKGVKKSTVNTLT